MHRKWKKVYLEQCRAAVTHREGGGGEKQEVLELGEEAGLVSQGGEIDWSHWNRNKIIFSSVYI